MKGDSDTFPVRQPKDVDGITQVMSGDENRFQYGRDGDHLLTSFQCGLCLTFETWRVEIQLRETPWTIEC